MEHKVASELADMLGQIYDVTFNQAEIAFITIHLRGAKRKILMTHRQIINVKKIKLNHLSKSRINFRYEFCRHRYIS